MTIQHDNAGDRGADVIIDVVRLRAVGVGESDQIRVWESGGGFEEANREVSTKPVPIARGIKFVFASRTDAVRSSNNAIRT